MIEVKYYVDTAKSEMMKLLVQSEINARVFFVVLTPYLAVNLTFCLGLILLTSSYRDFSSLFVLTITIL